MKRKPIFHWKITVFYEARMTAKQIFPFYMAVIAVIWQLHTRAFVLLVHYVIIIQTNNAVEAA